MSRTLYLGDDASRIELDGPALRIAAGDGADARVPLRLLARVVARGRAEWSTAALLACLAAGIPVSFLQPNGTPLGHCVPVDRRRAQLSQLLDRLERDWDAAAVFGNWALAEERRSILELLRRHAPERRDDEMRPDRLREAILAAAGAERAVAAAMLLALEGLLASHLPHVLLEAGLSPRWASPAPPGRLDMLAACNRAARWMLVPALDMALAHRREHADAWRRPNDRQRRLARRYEALAGSIVAATRRRLHRLELLLWEREP